MISPSGFARRGRMDVECGRRPRRRGDLKLVRPGRNGPRELCDLAKDRTGQNNLAAAQPDKVREPAAKWDARAQRAHVLPYPSPTGKPVPKKTK
jgi:hypothetical protein